MRVRGVNPVGNGPWSEYGEFATPPDNMPPTVANPIADQEQTIAPNGDAYMGFYLTVPLAGVFSDPEDTEMTVRVVSDNPAVVRVIDTNRGPVYEDVADLSLRINRPGTAVITLTATDEDPLRHGGQEHGKSVTTSFTITVSEGT